MVSVARAAAEKRAAAEELERLTALFARDAEAYFSSCLMIRPKTGRPVPFRMNANQRRIHVTAEQQRERTGRVRIVVPKARQIGCSTYVCARNFWLGTFTPSGLEIMLLTHQAKTTEKLLSLVHGFQDNCDPLFCQERVDQNLKNLRLRNGTVFAIATAGSESIGRGFTSQNFHGSEVAYWPNESAIAAGAMETVANEAGTEIFLESTGVSRSGLFYEYCQDAIAGRGQFEMVFLPWTLEPGYALTPPAGWEPSERWVDYGEARALNERQLYFAYMKNIGLIKGTDKELGVAGSPDEPCAKFLREYPAVVSDCFEELGFRKLVSAAAIARARKAKVELQDWAPRVLGVDPAGGGDDHTAMIDRQGRHIGRFFEKMPPGMNQMEVAQKIVDLKRTLRLDYCAIDVSGGYGIGIHDRLHHLGHHEWVVGVNFAMRSPDPRYDRLKAYIYYKAKEFIEQPLDVWMPDNEELAQHFLATAEVDPTAQGQGVEPKDRVRRRERMSPDFWDAFAVTFAMPWQSAEERAASFMRARAWEASAGSVFDPVIGL